MYLRIAAILAVRGVTAQDGDVRLKDDGQGATIEHWNTTRLGARPTAADLAAVTDADGLAAVLERQATRLADDVLTRALARVCWDELQKCTPRAGQTLLDLQGFRDRVKAVVRQLLT